MTWQRPSPLLAGLILGLFGSGRLLAEGYPHLALLVNSLASLLWLYLGGYFLIFLGHYAKLAQAGAVLSSIATYPMAGMLLAQFLQPRSPLLATLIWWLAVLLHVGLIGLFSWKWLRPGWSSQVIPSWTVLYVGIAMAGVTSVVTGASWLGTMSIAFGLLASLILFPVLIRRLRRDSLPAALAPQQAILTAPLSLLLVAILQQGWKLNPLGLLAFWALSQVCYIWVMSRLPRLLGQPFHPSFSALTFPLVISALATRQVSSHLGLGWTFLVQLEMVLALLVVSYVSLIYLALAWQSLSKHEKKRD